ncbi:2-polyprenyl-6-methoxyphenol hydroxylase-like FAD-dependent oxidoreductase [Saccharothrix ecbatanensis]|uniref:2-polyprenyl-6-methoxyphenol hydroxylase-like FAD-dependent oxidoreductase n=1 Tax=Saccharothrix ecbatanensis TaxID=1105145 RepID=A0A7W9HG56_9PSEU|nr:NAD(P)/FAD-dependent oxidoreductase [Saccharothrix ecbatanensis]MBB5801384.1 2-polyprenyl-6-methoxyphenol hydroxylase-like FAD-dependent oxidoreductase [Saccharothrix ecbatanensis]
MVRGLNVVIAGGGVGGLTLAGMLTQRGAHVTILERAPEMRHGFGLTMWPNAFRALRLVGGDKQYDAVVEVSQKLDNLVYRLGNGLKVADIDLVGTLVKKYGEPGYAVLRVELLEALASVAGADVRYGAEVTRATADGRVTLSTGEIIKGDIVIGADGVGSMVRKSLLPPGYVEPKSRQLLGWQGVVPKALTPGPGIAEVYFGPTGSSGMFPLPDGRTYWFFLDPGKDKPNLTGWNPIIQDMIRSTPPETMHRDEARDRPADPQWGTGRVTLLGDAAHPFLPTAGQGACIAIEDAAVLTRRLESINDPVAALRQFELDRFRRVRRVVGISRRLQSMQRTKPEFMRNFGLWMTPAWVITRMYGEPTFPIKEFL